jgi:hypothetical protein
MLNLTTLVALNGRAGKPGGQSRVRGVSSREIGSALPLFDTLRRHLLFHGLIDVRAAIPTVDRRNGPMGLEQLSEPHHGLFRHVRHGRPLAANSCPRVRQPNPPDTGTLS